MENKQSIFDNVGLYDTDYDSYISEIFKQTPILLERLKKLNEKKQEIKLLRSKYGTLDRPIVITISGTPRSGKTTCIDNLFEFLKKADLRTRCIEEPAGMIYQTLRTKEEKKQLLSDRIGFVEKQWDIGASSIRECLDENDIIICDRGIIDTFIWYDMYYKFGMMDQKRYIDYLKRMEELKKYCNYFYVLYSDSAESIKRDYINSLSIEPRTTMNQSNIEKYNKSLLDVLPKIKSIIQHTQFIDTTECDRMEASIIVANDVLDNVKKLYLKR